MIPFAHTVVDWPALPAASADDLVVAEKLYGCCLHHRTAVRTSLHTGDVYSLCLCCRESRQLDIPGAPASRDAKAIAAMWAGEVPRISQDDLLASQLIKRFEEKGWSVHYFTRDKQTSCSLSLGSRRWVSPFFPLKAQAIVWVMARAVQSGDLTRLARSVFV